MRVILVVADPIRQLVKLLFDIPADALVGHGVFQRGAHAGHPGVAFSRTDGEAGVAHPQAGMPAFLRVKRWPAKPFAEIVF